MKSSQLHESSLILLSNISSAALILPPSTHPAPPPRHKKKEEEEGFLFVQAACLSRMLLWLKFIVLFSLSSKHLNCKQLLISKQRAGSKEN